MKNVLCVNEKKFKSVFVSLNLLAYLDAKDISKNALLANVLKSGNKKYTTKRALKLKLADLYDASADIQVEKFSNYLSLKVAFEFINASVIEKIKEENIIDFIINYIGNPCIEDNQFNEDIVEREKKKLIEKINEEKDNKRSYALSKLEKIMFKNDAYGVSVLGDEEELINLTAKELYKFYMNVITNSKIVIQVVGNLDGYENLADNLNKELSNKFNNISSLEIKPSICLNERKGIMEEIENQQISQSIVTVGARFIDIKKEETYAAMVYAQILGGNPASLMFQNVREKASLAYFAKAMYNRQKEVIYAFAGIEPDKYEKAKELIVQQFELMKKGDFAEIQFTASKDTLISSYKEAYDDKIAIAKMKLANELYFGEDIDIEEILQNIQKVTIQDVINIANKVNVDTIYCLGGVRSE
ncbi:MAG: insulinase family protein [Clostridia bacterium]|nr:insulinase family protein [Clostridia bacterium]